MSIVDLLLVLVSMAFALSLFVNVSSLLHEELTQYLYEREELKRKERMRIRNHKHSKYAYISLKNGMTEIIKRESV